MDGQGNRCSVMAAITQSCRTSNGETVDRWSTMVDRRSTAVFWSTVKKKEAQLRSSSPSQDGGARKTRTLSAVVVLKHLALLDVDDTCQACSDTGSGLGMFWSRCPLYTSSNVHARANNLPAIVLASCALKS